MMGLVGGVPLMSAACLFQATGAGGGGAATGGSLASLGECLRERLPQ